MNSRVVWAAVIGSCTLALGGCGDTEIGKQTSPVSERRCSQFVQVNKSLADGGIDTSRIRVFQRKRIVSIDKMPRNIAEIIAQLSFGTNFRVYFDQSRTITGSYKQQGKSKKLRIFIAPTTKQGLCFGSAAIRFPVDCARGLVKNIATWSFRRTDCVYSSFVAIVANNVAALVVKFNDSTTRTRVSNNAAVIASATPDRIDVRKVTAVLKTGELVDVT